MAPRAYWKGYLKLSLVSCPIALYPATSEREKISFNQLNKDTGNRIRYRRSMRRRETKLSNQTSSKAMKSPKANTLNFLPRSLRRLPLRAGARSILSGSFQKPRSTSCTFAIRTISPLMAKSDNKHSR